MEAQDVSDAVQHNSEIYYCCMGCNELLVISFL